MFTPSDFQTWVGNVGTSSGAAGSSSGMATIGSTAAIPDRSVNLVIPRTDEGCEAAYDNCPVVYNSIKRLVSSVNTGFEVEAKDPKLEEENIKKLEDKIQELNVYDHLNACLTNREVFAVGAIGKRVQLQPTQDIMGLISLDTKDNNFKLIVDVKTGTLGGQTGIGLDKKRPKEEIVAIQKAIMVSYNPADGAVQKTNIEYIPLSNKDVMVLPNNERGQFRGVSSVRRVLRYVEELMSLENTVRLMSKRPTQLIYTLGNDTVNFNTMPVPQDYIKSAGGDTVAARKAYKTALMNAFITETEKLAEGDVLLQVLEYGMTVEAVTPTENMDYLKYMNYLVDQIKSGILTNETLGNRQVASGLMEEKLQTTLLRRAEMEQNIIMSWLNRELFWPLMEYLGIDKDKVWVLFKESEKEDEQLKWQTELLKAQTVMTYTNASFPIPKDIAGELDIEATAGGINHPLYEKKLQSKIDGLSPRDTMEEDLMRATLNIYRGGLGKSEKPKGV